MIKTAPAIVQVAKMDSAINVLVKIVLAQTVIVK